MVGAGPTTALSLHLSAVLPHALVADGVGAGQFLQEDAGEDVVELIVEFLRTRF